MKRPKSVKEQVKEARRKAADEVRQRFIRHCAEQGLPEPAPEYRFHPSRQWRADYAWPEHKVMLEVEGGVFTRGRHTRPTGYLEDMRKYTAAAVLGWRIVRCVPAELFSTYTLEAIHGAISYEPCENVAV